MAADDKILCFSQILTENPLPFSICIRNVDDSKTTATAVEESSACKEITSSLDQVIQIFLCACKEDEIEMEKLFDSLRNEKDSQESLEKLYRFVLNISKDVTAQLDEGAEKLFKTIVAAEKENLMTAEEKEYLNEYIRQQANFFNQLRDWMTKMLQDILVKFVQGHTGEVKAASLLFQTVVQILQTADIHRIIDANCHIK